MGGKHFEENYYRKGKNEVMLTIFNPTIQTSQYTSSNHVMSPVIVPRRSPRKRTYQDDQYQSFMNYDLINKLSGIEESLSPAGFLFKENNDHLLQNWI